MGIAVVIILVMCVGAWLMISGLRDNAKCTESIEATIIRHEYDPENSNYVVYYEYTYSDQKYEGWEYKLPSGRYIRGKEEVEKIYPIGSRIHVFINPEKPHQSQTPQSGSSQNGCLVAGLVICLVFICIFALILSKVAGN